MPPFIPAHIGNAPTRNHTIRMLHVMFVSYLKFAGIFLKLFAGLHREIIYTVIHAVKISDSHLNSCRLCINP